jgi:ATP-dependent DNA ligase
MAKPRAEAAYRNERFRKQLSDARAPLQFSDRRIGCGRALCERACALKLKGIVSKRVDPPILPGIAACGLK